MDETQKNRPEPAAVPAVIPAVVPEVVEPDPPAEVDEDKVAEAAERGRITRDDDDKGKR